MEVLKYLNPWFSKDPEPGKGEALIRVLVTSLNRLDTIIRRGSYLLRCFTYWAPIFGHY